ncbi:BREX system ATP-binding domain-containing protein [Streptomyces sp. NPDC052701]|uniref:BREX system ATP-binding domain-containing protein n=1 Tax=Streptomyces sp. NPDC052701 TaxID=3155533 RepID=UPI003425B319
MGKAHQAGGRLVRRVEPADPGAVGGKRFGHDVSASFPGALIRSPALRCAAVRVTPFKLCKDRVRQSGKPLLRDSIPLAIAPSVRISLRNPSVTRGESAISACRNSSKLARIIPCTHWASKESRIKLAAIPALGTSRSTPTAHRSGRAVRARPATSRRHGGEVTLVGRETILHTLDKRLETCASGEAHTVLIEGAVGCGKSEVLDTFAKRAARSGALVLQAFGSAAESTLPLGVMRQLLASAGPGPLPPPSSLDDASVTAAMNVFCAGLHAATADASVVACVDDLHLVDDASLRFLAHVLRHAHSASFLLVLTSPLHEAPNIDFRTELLRRDSVTRARLERLAPQEAAAALASSAPQYDEDLAALLHRSSGGNPLLLRALAEEYRWTAPRASGEPLADFPAVGGLFVQAAETCLRRSGPVALDVARAVAVLGTDGTEAEIARLLNMTVPDVTHQLASLAAAGIVEDRRFGHPAVPTALLGRMNTADRAELHRRAAEVLYDGGRPALRVAGHLVTAQQSGAVLPQEQWVTDLLRDAAEELVEADDLEQATAVLEAAYAGRPDPQQRAEIKIRLSAITWRLNPATAEQHLSEPLALLRDGGLATERMESLASVLLAQGRLEEAHETRRHIAEALGTECGAPAEGTDWPLPDADPAGETASCEWFLQTTALQDTTLLPIARAIRTLIHSEQPESAVAWCRRRLTEAGRYRAPAWRAVFATLHAEALLRLGDLRGAEEQALQALQFLPQRSGNAFAGSPAAHLIRARTSMGRHAAAAAQLEQPVPSTLFHSVHGLPYLRARGLHWLATGQLRSALADFLEAGRLAQEWGLDHPSVLAWRGDAAEVLLRLGDAEQAEQLLLQQMAKPDARRSWVRGTSLRLRAATQPAARRTALLQQAVDELRKSGDRLELAQALADLAQAHQDNGDAAKASASSRQAWSLAETCGAEPLRERILPGVRAEVHPVRRPAQAPALPDSEGTLSESERRVATLAARGYTNRQISRELYITVSTVEQHLTRVYRKLSITRRQDLPADLRIVSREIA